MLIQLHKAAGSNHHQQQQLKMKEEKKSSCSKFNINDNPDILIEILKRLDDRSLGVAACVCRLWCNISRYDSIWENLCFRHVYPPPSDIRPVVLALGGYRKLYMVCLRPVLNRLSRLSLDFGGTEGGGRGDSGRVVGTVRTREEVQLSLSLFSIDFYERLGERLGEASSLMFLCNPVNV
ncbi:F-box domain [Macleaya cordata]|uniref:F-box domain n=1 Tax=Macleaya cordata TaxID=56857 RepID=A0A200RBT0_MACCD|nr:F-box domain [Macleaya cordata]